MGIPLRWYALLPRASWGPRLPHPARSLGADGSRPPSGAVGAPASPPSPPSRTYAKQGFVHLASQVAKGLRPTKPPVLRKCGGLPWAGWAARFRSRWIVGGDTPPHHPPDLSRGAPGASLSVGARLRPVSALPRPPRSAGFAAPRPGRLRPSLAPPQRRPYRVRLRPCTLRAVSASAIA